MEDAEVLRTGRERRPWPPEVGAILAYCPGGVTIGGQHWEA